MQPQLHRSCKTSQFETVQLCGEIGVRPTKDQQNCKAQLPSLRSPETIRDETEVRMNGCNVSKLRPDTHHDHTDLALSVRSNLSELCTECPKCANEPRRPNQEAGICILVF